MPYSFLKTASILLFAAFLGVAGAALYGYLSPEHRLDFGFGTETEEAPKFSSEATATTVPSDWADAPATPGDWLVREKDGQSQAAFGDDLVVVTCDRTAGVVSLRIEQPGSDASTVSILSTSQARSFSGARTDQSLTISLQTSDEILDAMVFTRGNFAVSVEGADPLYLPSWPELARVIEDCR